MARVCLAAIVGTIDHPPNQAEVEAAHRSLIVILQGMERTVSESDLSVLRHRVITGITKRLIQALLCQPDTNAVGSRDQILSLDGSQRDRLEEYPCRGPVPARRQ